MGWARALPVVLLAALAPRAAAADCAEGDVGCEGRRLEEGDGAGNQTPCVDGNSSLDSMGRSCQWYQQTPAACGAYDTAEFTARQTCCACRQAPRCRNTNSLAKDIFGGDCAVYEAARGSGRDKCGKYDTPHFQASVMCCACGGGTDGDLCPHHAASALPDTDGLCRCGPDHVCDEAYQGRGCRALPGQRSTTRFHPTCLDCRCVNEAPFQLSPARDESCSTRFEETGLPDASDSWKVFTVLLKIRDQILEIGQAVTDVRQQWVAMPDKEQMLAWSLLTSDSTHGRWARMLARSIMNSKFFVRSCGVYLPDSGLGISLESESCTDPKAHILVSSANDDQKIRSHRLRGVRCTGSNSRSCHTRAIWYEGSYNETMVTYPDGNGTWQYGTAPGDVRHEAWFQQLSSMTDDTLLLLDGWSSTLEKAMMFGFGQQLITINPTTVHGLVRCAVSNRGFSNFLRTLVGAGVRIFMVNRYGALQAASRGEVERASDDPSRPLPQKLSSWESSDPVIRHVGAWLAKNTMWLQTSFFSGHLAWPEMRVSARTYIMREAFGATELFIVYATPPTCDPGWEMVANSSWDVVNCTRCPAGRFASDGLTVGDRCQGCSAGSYASAPGSTRCLTCSEGEYQSESGGTECKACPVNTTSIKGAGLLSNCRCKPDFYSLQGIPGTSCAPCPAGASCSGEEEPPIPKKKYYQLTREVRSEQLPQGYLHREYIKCRSRLEGNPCKRGRAGLTPSGEAVVENVCEDGYEGVGCSYCSEGYYRFGRDCMACASDDYDQLLRFYWVCFIVVFYLLRRVVNSRYKTLYIFLSFLQVFGLQGSFSLAWPARIKYVMRIIQVANLQVDLLMPSCERETSYTFKYLLYLGMPWFFLTVDIVVMLVSKAWTAYRSPEVASAEPTSQQATAAVAAAAPSPEQEGDRPGEQEVGRREPDREGSVSSAPSSSLRTSLRRPMPMTPLDKAKRAAAFHLGNKAVCRRELFLDFTGQALCNMRLMFLSLCGRTLDMVHCTYLHGGLPSRLSKDMNIICWEGTHLDYMPLVGVATVFYVIGTPLAYMCILYSGHRNNVLYSPAHVKRYGLLYSRFEPEFYYYELVIMLRRVLAVVIKTVLNIRTAEYQRSGYIGNFQAALMASVMVAALAVHFYTHPFISAWLDVGDAIYLGTTFFSCIIGICFSTVRNPEEHQAMETLWFLILIFSCLVTVVLVWHDMEVVHPKMHRLRKRVTDWMGCPLLAQGLRSRLRTVSANDRRKLEMTEVITGIDYAMLEQKPAFRSILKAFLAHGLQEKVEHLGISPHHVSVHLSEGPGPKSVEVRTTIAPPTGISTKVVQPAVAGHCQAELARSLLRGFVDVMEPTDRHVSDRAQI